MRARESDRCPRSGRVESHFRNRSLKRVRSRVNAREGILFICSAARKSERETRESARQAKRTVITIAAQEAALVDDDDNRDASDGDASRTSPITVRRPRGPLSREAFPLTLRG